MRSAWSFAFGVIFASAIMFVFVQVRARQRGGEERSANAPLPLASPTPPSAIPVDPTIAVAELHPGMHQAILEQERREPPGVLFLGDSLTDMWRAVPWIWDENFARFHPCNAGIIF